MSAITTPASAENPLPLATLSDKGKPPKQRLSSAADAQSLFWTLHEAALPRLTQARVIQGNFDGNPPYNPAKMRNSGNAWRPNFNTLEGSSRLDAAKVPYYDLLSAVPQYADCMTDVATDTVDASTATRVRTQAFDTMLQSYDDFDDEFWTAFTDFVAFNKCFLWFPRPDSWHFERLPWHKVYFPDGTSTKTSRWELFAIKHEWPVHKLYGFIKDEDAATAAGWNVKQVWRAIQLAAPEDIGNAYRDPLTLQKAFRDSELTMTARIGTVQAASIYTREFDGSWSRMMVQVQQGQERTASSAPRSAVERSKGQTFDADTGVEVSGQLTSKDWLYNKRDVAKSVYEIMCPFVFEVGDGSINELSGLGKKIVSISQATDRLANEMLCSSLMQSSIVLQATTGALQAKQAIIQFGGPVTTVPAGYVIQPGTIWGNLEAPLAVSTDLRNRLDANTGTYRPSYEKPRGNPESATGAQLRYTQGAILSNAAVNRFTRQLDKFYMEVYRRAAMALPKTSSDAGIKAAIEFQEECRAADLSDKQIRDQKPGSVRAFRTAGNGSPMMRQQMMAQLAQYVPYMGPRGLENWLVDSLAAYGGSRAAERYRPKEDQQVQPTEAMRVATGENNDMQTGAQVIFMDSDNHEEHAKVHLTGAVAAIQSVQQGADPAMPFTFLQLVMPHAGMHISKVGRKTVRDELEKAYKQVAAGAQDVFKAAQKQVQQQGQQQQLSFEQQLAMQKAQGDLQVSQFKAKSRAELSAERQQFDMQQQQTKMQYDWQLMQLKVQQEAALKDSTTAGTIQRDTATTVASIELQKATTAADIQTKRMVAQAKASEPKPTSK